jgi:hypothetical protein
VRVTVVHEYIGSNLHSESCQCGGRRRATESLCGGAWETAVLLNEDGSVRCFRGDCHDHDSDGDSESARLPRSLEWRPAIASGPRLPTGATGAGGLRAALVASWCPLVAEVRGLLVAGQGSG